MRIFHHGMSCSEYNYADVFDKAWKRAQSSVAKAPERGGYCVIYQYDPRTRVELSMVDVWCEYDDSGSVVCPPTGKKSVDFDCSAADVIRMLL